MNKNMLILLLLAATSCVKYNCLQGEYYKKGEDYEYILILNSDSTFTYKKNYFESQGMCNGKWKTLSNNTLLLNCFEEKSVLTQISSGYMTERENKIIVLSKDRLKIGKIILKKRK